MSCRCLQGMPQVRLVHSPLRGKHASAVTCCGDATGPDSHHLHGLQRAHARLWLAAPLLLLPAGTICTSQLTAVLPRERLARWHHCRLTHTIGRGLPEHVRVC